jgi:GH43 family beta-xylosidase
MAWIMGLMGALPSAGQTFQNPLNPSADPWMGFVEGEYHLSTTQGDCVRLWSARSINGLKDAKPVMTWGKGKGVWAAEFHHLQGQTDRRWYCYFSGNPVGKDGWRRASSHSMARAIRWPFMTHRASGSPCAP